MTDAEERPFMRAQLSDFSLVVLHHAVVLLLLTHSCGGQSQTTGPPQPIMAMIGNDIILPCHLRSSGNPLDVTVEWTRPDLEPKFVHLRRDRGDLLDEQNPSYTGRTSLSDNRLKCGDLSLKLSSVGLSDAGTYQCLVPGSITESMVELVVGSVSSPKIVISKVSNGVLLDCESKGWYPEPEASWLDSKGKLLSTGTSETVTGPDKLYTVSSRVTVEKQHSSSFTCRVQQKTINQTTEAQIHVRDDFFNTQSTTAVRITISLVACFMCILTVALVAWRIKRTEKCPDKTEPDKNTTRSNNLELQFLMAEHEATEHLMTSREKMKYLDTAMEKLDEEKKRSEEEQKHVEDMILMLKKQRKYLGKQKETLRSTLEVMRKCKEEGEKNLEGKFVMDRKKKIENVKHLEGGIEDQKAQLANTDQLLTDTEEMTSRMTERKGKLEREREQIEKDMKKIEKKREEVREGEREDKKEKVRGCSEGPQLEKGKREGEQTEKDIKKTEKLREPEVRGPERGSGKEGARGGPERLQSEKEEETDHLI